MSRTRFHAFTLMELLIVISIISILATLTAGTVSVFVKMSKVTGAKATITKFDAALQKYQSDCGAFPATPKDHTQNADVFAALTGDLNHDGVYTPGTGKGGGNEDIPKNHPTWRGPYLTESPKTDAEGNVLDLWGKPYRYFENAREAPKCSINPKSFLLYSLGPDGQATDATREDVIDFSKPFNKDNVKNWEDE